MRWLPAATRPGLGHMRSAGGAADRTPDGQDADEELGGPAWLADDADRSFRDVIDVDAAGDDRIRDTSTAEAPDGWSDGVLRLRHADRA